jgi:CBS domain-containing protein
MSIGESCIRDVVILAPTASIAEAAKLMRAHHVGDVVIVEEAFGERRPVGLVTDRDIVVEVIAEGLDPNAISVSDVMTRRVETVTDTTSFWDAVRRMRVCGVRRMPIVDRNGALQGIFTLDDALVMIGDCVGDLTRLVDREIEHERKSRPSRSNHAQ